MKFRLVAALLASTMLTPAPAQAGPVVPFIQGVAAGLAGNAVIGGSFLSAGFLSGVAASTYLTAGLGGIVFRTLVGVGLSALAQAFLPQPSLPQPSAQMGNFAQPVSYAEWVYGQTRKGGPIGFTAVNGDRRFYVPILAAHEIDGVAEHWLDEYTVGVDADAADFDTANLRTNADSSEFTGPAILAGRGRIEVFTGAPGQAANAGLIDKFDEITAAHDFAGLAGAVLWAKRVPAQNFAEVYPNGRQWAYTPVINGNNRIWDPRDQSEKYTNNAALCIAHWITVVLGQRVNWVEVAAEADVCDQTVTMADGTTRARWTINGTLRDDQSFETQRAQMAGACDAFMYQRADGAVGFKVGRWIEPEITLTDDDFLSLRVREGQAGFDAPTEVSVLYVEPSNAWRESASGSWIEDPNSRRIRDEPQLNLVNDHGQAVYLAKRVARVRRPEFTLQGSLGAIGYELIGQRFFRVSHPLIPDGTTFEVGRLERLDAATFQIEAVSVTEDDFTVGAAEEPARPVLKSVDSALTTPDITNLAVAAEAGAALQVTWDEQPDYLWQQIRWKPVAAASWQSVTIDSGETDHRISGLLDGTTYQVEGRNAGAGLLTKPSDWLAADPAIIQTVGNSAAPTAMSAFDAVADGADVLVTFTAPNDPNYFAVRVHRGETAVFADAVLVHTEFASSGAAAWTDTPPTSGTFRYWATPINGSQVEGPSTGPVEVTL